MSGDIAKAIGGKGIDTDRDDLPTGDFQPLPAGWYPVNVDKVEIRDTKKKDGKYVWAQLTVIGEHYKNRKLFAKFNIVNKSEEAVKIGWRDLAGIGDACGLSTVEDSKQLMGKQLDVRVKIKTEEGRDPDNEPTAYAKLGRWTSGEQATKAPKGKPAEKAKAWDGPPAGSAAAPAQGPAADAGAAGDTKPAAGKPAGKRPWE